MNLYSSTVEHILALPGLRAWPEFEEILNRMAALEPRDWQLPVKACQAVGGSVKQAIPAAAAIACSQISIIMIDDMLDEDPRGEYHRLGSAGAANLSAAFQAAASEALISSGLKPATKLSALQSIERMILTVAFGQHLDVQNPADEAAYWRVVESKSATFFGTAFQLGALAGGADKRQGAALERLGQLYGELIQIHDDLNDVMEVPANPDWAGGRSPLPILFARVVDHPDRARFLELNRDVTNLNALQEAQDILVRCGAISYCLDQLVRRYQTAHEILRARPLLHPRGVETLLEATITPVKRLFAAIGKIPPSFSRLTND